VEEKKEKNKKREVEQDMYRIITPFDIAVKLDQLKNVVDYVLITVDDIDKKIKKLSRRTKSDTSDILFFMFILALMMRTQQTPIQIPTPTVQANPSTNVSIEKIQKILRECRRSANPLECVENQLFGG
jgi:hypothetical protein